MKQELNKEIEEQKTKLKEIFISFQRKTGLSIDSVYFNSVKPYGHNDPALLDIKLNFKEK